MRRLIPTRRGFTLAELFVVVGILTAIGLVLLPAISRSGSAYFRERIECRKQLKQITLALGNYEAEYGSLPPAVLTDAAGTPLHSWRTLILPFLDEGGDGQRLYDQLDLSQPWDAPVNQAACEAVFEGDSHPFRCPSCEAGSHATTYLAVLPERGQWGGPLTAVANQSADGSMDGAVDARSPDAVLFVEVPDELAEPWMKPVDIDRAGLRRADEYNTTVGPHHHHAAFGNGPVKDVYRWSDFFDDNDSEAGGNDDGIVAIDRD